MHALTRTCTARWALATHANPLHAARSPWRSTSPTRTASFPMTPPRRSFLRLPRRTQILAHCTSPIHQNVRRDEKPNPGRLKGTVSAFDLHLPGTTVRRCARDTLLEALPSLGDSAIFRGMEVRRNIRRSRKMMLGHGCGRPDPLPAHPRAPHLQGLKGSYRSPRLHAPSRPHPRWLPPRPSTPAPAPSALRFPPRCAQWSQRLPPDYCNRAK